MSSLDGERAWRDLSNRLDENTKADYFRFNISIPIGEACIDDTDQMKELKKCVHLLPHDLKDRINAASALLIASFYFELQALNGCMHIFQTLQFRNSQIGLISSFDK